MSELGEERHGNKLAASRATRNFVTMAKELKSLLVFVFMLALFFVEANAQPLPPPSSTPLDPLSWVLLAGAGTFAGKKFYDSKYGKKE